MGAAAGFKAECFLSIPSPERLNAGVQMPISIPGHSRVFIEVLKSLAKLKHSLKHEGGKNVTIFGFQSTRYRFQDPSSTCLLSPPHLSRACRGFWVASASLTPRSGLPEMQVPASTASYQLDC